MIFTKTFVTGHENIIYISQLQIDIEQLTIRSISPINQYVHTILFCLNQQIVMAVLRTFTPDCSFFDKI